MSRIPLTKIDPKIETRILELGGKPLHLYQTLTHHPQLLSAWLGFAYSLRKDCKTPRSLRELMILRGAQLTNSAYEWQQHVRMALQSDVSQEKIDALTNWQDSHLYSDLERAGLELMEAIVSGKVNDELFEKVSQHFSHDEYIELVLTGSFYCMVPRVLDALQVPLEK